MQVKRIFLISLTLMAVGWIMVFLSSKALFVYGEKSRTINSQEILNCFYFTGTGIIKKEFWYAANSFLGRSACPRIEDI